MAGLDLLRKEALIDCLLVSAIPQVVLSRLHRRLKAGEVTGAGLNHIDTVMVNGESCASLGVPVLGLGGTSEGRRWDALLNEYHAAVAPTVCVTRPSAEAIVLRGNHQ